MNVKASDELGVQHKSCWNPTSFLWAVAFPVHKVLKATAPTMNIQQFFDSICIATIDNTAGRTGRRSGTRDE